MNVELLVSGAALLVGFVLFVLGVSIPDYTGLGRQVWSDPVPVVGKLYMLLGYLATAALGAALLQTGFLPAWIGWVSVVLGAAGAIVILVGRPSPDWTEETYAEIPFWLQIAPFLMGIALILRA